MPTLTTSPGSYVDDRRLVNLDQLASATASTVDGGAAHGCRAIDLRVVGGIDVRILPDRGLDIGAAWFAGVPLAWISATGETGPLPAPRELDWLLAFGGGLMTTCGLRNVGVPSEGHGQHGDVSHRPARDVRSERRITGDGQAELVVTGTVEETAGLTGHLRLERRITTRTGTPLLEVADQVTNLGPVPEAAPLLYHVNLGVPLWDAGATLAITADEVMPRDDDARAGLDSWSDHPQPDAAAPERVFAHRLAPGADGLAVATVTNPTLGLSLRLSWDAGGLPRCHQWVHPGIGVLGIEPANCSVLGRAADRAAGTLPMLEPRESRRTGVRITAELLE